MLSSILSVITEAGGLIGLVLARGAMEFMRAPLERERALESTEEGDCD